MGRTRQLSPSAYAAAAMLAELTGTAAQPGLYRQLFDVVEPASGLHVVGGRRGRSSGVPDPVRIEVLDAIAAIADFALRPRGLGHSRGAAVDATQRRKAWGLAPHDAAAGGHVPDAKVLDALRWLDLVLPAVDAEMLPRFIEELASLTNEACKLCGVARAYGAAAECPYCHLASVHVDPWNSDVAMCITPGCGDEHGNRPTWVDWREWAELDASA